MSYNKLKLYLITNFTNYSFAQYQQLLLQAIDGGVTAVQLRAKTFSFNKIYQLALKLKKILDPLNIPLIINDHIEIAWAINAAGVHIGNTDLDPLTARKLLGPNKIVGISIESLADLNNANNLQQIDYVAASAVFISKNKNNCKKIWGIDGLKQLTKLSQHPVIAIGGINQTNVKLVAQCNVAGIAVIGAIHDATDPKKAATEMIDAIEKMKKWI